MNSHSTTEKDKLVELDSRVVFIVVINNVDLHLFVLQSNLIRVVKVKLFKVLRRSNCQNVIMKIVYREARWDQLKLDTHCNN